MKVIGVEVEANGKQTEVSLVQTHVNTGPVDPVQVSPPKGYITMDLRKITADKLVQTMQSLSPLLNGGTHQ